MTNDTSCSPNGDCPILVGTKTNGTFFVAQYDPRFTPTIWRQNMELVTICVCNSLTLILIVSRLIYRWRKIKKLRNDDMWMAVAGVFVMALFASQLGANFYGSGLWMRSVKKAWRPWHWRFSIGFSAYYIVVSCIKLSVCCCFLQILTYNLKSLRYCVFGLCAIIASLGAVCTFPWIFGCSPFLSNFYWSVPMDSCTNYDIFRWLWISVSVPVDLVIMSVPLRILNRVRLRVHEKRILQMVFCATFLGTLACLVGIYGSFRTRTVESNELFYNEVTFIMMNDIETFCYALGASFPVLSRYIVAKTDPGPDPTHANFSSWARYIPDFFRDASLQNTRHSHRNSHRNTTRRTTLDVRNTSPELHTPIKCPDEHSLPSGSDHNLQIGSSDSLYKSGSGSSVAEIDLEKSAAPGKARVVHVRTDVVIERRSGEQTLQEYLKTSQHGSSEGW
ncbi:hypothetical protein WAI453_009384 [Rhynchosporium graminicola]|uniref:Rhodopsin domain-containing protein n=1 Tax=Rhynchosporium graminicola TaxID=2792576 RepID=A0A1E1LIG0_9HELO|nr:uncharacterized protein RCO7_02910 [Rhynchosporium commune]